MKMNKKSNKIMMKICKTKKWILKIFNQEFKKF